MRAAAVCLLLFSVCLFAQQPPDKGPYEKDKAHALELYDAQNFVAALPELQQLAEQNPKDVVVLEHLAFCYLSRGERANDPGVRKNAFESSLKYANAAKALGDYSEILLLILEKVKPDSAPIVYSTNEQVNALMQQGEDAFAKGKFEEAKTAYQQALLLEPKNYSANLYLGDVYFKQKQYGSSIEWFQKAAEADPDRDTAYRYWGDALERLNQPAEARKQFIQAVIAQPYSNNTWRHLQVWAKDQGTDLTIPQIHSPNSVKKEADNSINVTIDSNSLDKKDGSGAWFIYTLSRATWQGDTFKKNFPQEKEYRHSLKEESSCLELVVGQLKGDKKIKHMDPQLAMLMKISSAGLLEPYILLNAADDGIAQDYSEYRKQHRDLLYQYLDTIVVPTAKPSS